MNPGSRPIRWINIVAVLVTSLLLIFVGGRPAQAPSSTNDDALPPEVERQLRLIERLAAEIPATGKPDHRLFGAITRLEESLPRSIETRRAQQEGRRRFLETLRSHSARRAAQWEQIREKLQRRIDKDRRYVQAMKAIDMRLAAAALARTAANHSPPYRRALPLNEMRPGDIMLWDDRSGRPFVRFAVSLFAWKCTHSAIYLGEQRSKPGHAVRLTYEALNPDRGVRVSIMDQKWMRHGLHISLGHVSGFTPGAAEKLARLAVQQFGSNGRTPYHVWPPWDKTVTTSGLYCSQLVWKVYSQNGRDLDSNHWTFLAWFSLHNWYDPYAPATAYFGVFPDEIKMSPQITWYYDQENP